MTKDYIVKFNSPINADRTNSAYDLANDFARFREMFVSKCMDPPVAIHLKSRSEGIRFMYQIQPLIAPSGQDGGAKLLKSDDGFLYVEIEFMGIKVRWPEDESILDDNHLSL